jgi:hypothetical protein
VAVIEIIDKHRKNYLWRGSEFKRKGYNLAAWNLVQKPKSRGGLGVINLRLQNDALLLKHLDKFYRKEDVQWVKLIWNKYYLDSVPHLAREKGSFWWKDILRLNVLFRGVAICSPNKGDTLSFWEDIIFGEVGAEVFPNLYPYAKDPKASLWKLKSTQELLTCFRIPMSRQAYNEFLLLQNAITSLPPTSSHANDVWCFIWGNQKYSARRFYHHHYSSVHPPRSVLWL